MDKIHSSWNLLPGQHLRSATLTRFDRPTAATDRFPMLMSAPTSWSGHDGVCPEAPGTARLNCRRLAVRAARGRVSWMHLRPLRVRASCQRCASSGKEPCAGPSSRSPGALTGARPVEEVERSRTVESPRAGCALCGCAGPLENAPLNNAQPGGGGLSGPICDQGIRPNRSPRPILGAPSVPGAAAGARKGRPFPGRPECDASFRGQHRAGV
jgi:hypothetical protein